MIAARTGAIVVEDEALVRADLVDCLRSSGVEVLGQTDSAEQAVALAERHRPDLALVDIGLKGAIDGITLASILSDRRIPVIYVTGRPDRALTTGRAHAAGVIAKPFTAGEVQAVVAAVLRSAAHHHA